jgi:hypothetical protein
MLSLPTHLARIVRISYPSGASEMRRQAQHDVLLFLYCFGYTSSVPGTSGSLATVAGRFLPRTCTKICVPGLASSAFT